MRAAPERASGDHLRETLPRMVTALQTDPEGCYRLHRLEGAPPHHEAAGAGRAATTRTGS